MAQGISVSLQDRVLTVTLDRADKRNALTHEMYTGLAEALERADADPDVRVVVLRAEDRFEVCLLYTSPSPRD